MSERQSTTSDNKPTKVAIAGLGGSAHGIILPALTTMREVDVVAGCDVVAQSRDRARKSWKIGRIYEDPEEMLKNEHPDVAVICTPPLTHCDLSLLALHYDCHVFCEKPFTPSVEDADKVISAARQKQRVVAVNNQYYQMPIFKKVKEYLEGPQLGRLYHIDVWQQLYQIPAEEGGWKAALQPNRVLYEFGTHALDLICQFFGDYPISVSARIPRVRQDVDADVSVTLRLDFPEERVASIRINRVSHAPKKYLEMRLDCEKGALRPSLGGVASLDLGWNSHLGRPTVNFSLTKGGELRWERQGGSKQVARQPFNDVSKASGAHFSQFLSAIEQGVEPMVSAAHARRVIELVFAGYDSAAAGGQLVQLSGSSEGTVPKLSDIPTRTG